MRLPNFLIIGAAKSGTTTLYQYLSRHPQIYMSVPKEPGFFVLVNKEKHKPKWNFLNKQTEYSLVPSEVYQKGIDWYASLFSDAKPDMVCGEATQIYTQHPHFQSAKLIAKHLPDVKLIYIMRHPIERAYSHYAYRLKLSQIKKSKLIKSYSFEDSIKQHNLYLDASNYIQQIEQYLQFYSRDSLCLLMMKDLINEPKETLRKVCRFIKVEENIDLVQKQTIVSNKSSSLTDQLSKLYFDSIESFPSIYYAEKVLPKNVYNTIYKSLNKRFKKQYLPQPMQLKTRQMLIKYFLESNKKIEELCNRDLSYWSK